MPLTRRGFGGVEQQQQPQPRRSLVSLLLFLPITRRLRVHLPPLLACRISSLSLRRYFYELEKGKKEGGRFLSKRTEATKKKKNGLVSLFFPDSWHPPGPQNLPPPSSPCPRRRPRGGSSSATPATAATGRPAGAAGAAAATATATTRRPSRSCASGGRGIRVQIQIRPPPRSPRSPRPGPSFFALRIASRFRPRRQPRRPLRLLPLKKKKKKRPLATRRRRKQEQARTAVPHLRRPPCCPRPRPSRRLRPPCPPLLLLRRDPCCATAATSRGRRCLP
jgi:hypothetical protein